MNTTQQKTPTDRVVQFLDKKGKLELATGMVGLRGLMFGQKQLEKQQAAEDEFVRRSLWNAKPETDFGADMGHTILGDIHQPPAVIMPTQQGNGFGSLLGAALVGASLLGIPGAGVAAYLYGRSQTEPAKPATTIVQPGESMGLGLLKFEDLKRAE